MVQVTGHNKKEYRALCTKLKKNKEKPEENIQSNQQRKERYVKDVGTNQ